MRKVFAGLVAAVAVTVPMPASAETPGTVSWTACPEDLPSLECATVEVPLDYRDPGGRTIDIAISRMAAPDPAKRRGVLFTNGGGPGSTGLIQPLVLKVLGLPDSVTDAYDVIGIDPRGVGRSVPVTCDLDVSEPTATANIPEYALDPADVAARAERVAETAASCGSSSTAEILPHINTANTARDMDRIRQALGESTISYHGMSYGTYLGAVYATLFPDRTDRFVLDSALGPEGTFTGVRGFARGFQDRFPDFAELAAANPDYGLGTTPEQVKGTYFELAARLDETPRPDGFDGKRFRHVTLEKLYTDDWLPELLEIWRAVDTGGPLPPTTPVPPPPPGQPADNPVAAQLAVVCNDTDWPESVATYQRNVEIDRFRYPMFGAAAANIWPCAFWPTEPIEPPVEITGDGPSNVLIVQNLRDPSTPLAGAQELRAALGDHARLVTADQGGHVAYLLMKNRCLNDTTTDFLVTGRLPAEDLACAAEPA